jgi:hypothetical protein
VRGLAPEVAERVIAEAWAAGACGAEEREDAGGTRLLLYATLERADAVRDAARGAAGAGADVGAAEPVADVD